MASDDPKRCEAFFVWRQGRGPIDPRAGRIHRCIKAAGHPEHEGHVYEATADRVEPPPTYFAWLKPKPKRPEVARVDLHALFRENARKRTFGR